MISHSVVQGKTISLSFSADDSSLGEIFMTVAVLRSSLPELRCDVSAGNVKYSFYGENMKDIPGVAAALFEFLSKNEIMIKMITTSLCDISLLIDKADEIKLDSAIKDMGL